jgi:hypothetical protein
MFWLKTVRLLFGETKQRGYMGSYSHRALFIAPGNNAGRPHDLIVEASLGRASPDCDTLSPAPRRRVVKSLTAAALWVKPRGQMTTRQRAIIDALKAGSEEFTATRQLAMRRHLHNAPFCKHFASR